MLHTEHETPTSIVDAFQRELPEIARRMNREVLCELLEQVYLQAARGRLRAKTERQLESESLAAGIDPTEYEALLSLAAVAAGDLPIDE
jgi:hypothetical protein